MPDYLSRYDPDPLRYLLSINMPETSDTDFSWREFVRRNNDELVATYGNLVNRVLTFTYKQLRWQRARLRANWTRQSQALLDKAAETLDKLWTAALPLPFQGGHQSGHVAGPGSQPLPGREVALEDDQDRTVRRRGHVALYGHRGHHRLKTVLYPFLPFSSQKLHEYLGLHRRCAGGSAGAWSCTGAGAEAGHAQPLFIKLDDEIIAIEESKLGH